MSQPVNPADLLLQRLQEHEGQWSQRVSDLLIEYALNLPAKALVAHDEVVGLVTQSLMESSVRVATDGHVKPAWRRQQERARATKDTVGDALPPQAVLAIEKILERGVGPKFAWLEGAVDPKLITQLIAPIVQQVLLGFVTKIPGTLGSSSASLMGMLGRGVQQRASALADVGKAVMGGIGVDVEKKLQNAAKDFSHTASNTIRDATRARLVSAEGQDLMRQISTQVFAHIRGTQVFAIQDDIARLPLEEIIDLVPVIVAHNRVRPMIESVVRDEVAAAMQFVGDQSIGELLAAHGLRDSVDAIARRVVPPTLSSFFASPAAVALVHDLLTPTTE